MVPFTSRNLGATDGLIWELSCILDNAKPERVILSLPFTRIPRAERQKIWQSFVLGFGPKFQQPLPLKIGDALFVWFDTRFLRESSASFAERKATNGEVILELFLSGRISSFRADSGLSWQCIVAVFGAR